MFTRAKCEGCGAPLEIPVKSRKTVCSYCGAEYYSENNDANPIEERNEYKSTIETNTLDHQNLGLPLDAEKKKLPIWIWIILITSILFWYGILNIDRLFTTSPNRISESTKVVKPQMVTTLPKAEKAGKAIPYDGWEIIVKPDFEVIDGRLFFSFDVINWNDKVQTIQYIPKNIVVYDDLGNTYNLDNGSCDIDLPYLERQITAVPFEKIVMKSEISWCNQGNSIPAFSGVIPNNANHLYLFLEDFGVFTRKIFVFDL